MIPLPKPVSHFQRRPALFVFIALACGIAFGNAIADTLTVFRLSFLLLPVVLGVSFVFRKKPHLLPVFAFVLSFAFGALLISLSRMDEQNSILARYADATTEEAALVGEIDDIREGKGLYIRLKCDSLVTTGGSVAVDEAAGILLHNPDSPKQSSLKRGDKVKVFGELASFVPQRNPYAFDYDEYLRRNERIDVRLYCNSYYDLIKIGEESPSLYDNALNFFTSLRDDIAGGISNVIHDTLTRGFVVAMLLGERTALPRDVWEDFRNAGLSHILVVSGFNLGIVAWMFFLLLRLFRAGRREIRFGLVMTGALFYAALIGPQPSVIRAVIVVELFLLGRLVESRSDLANLTAGAALIDLVLNPADLLNVGFQLSYAAVFSLTLIAPALDRFLFGSKAIEVMQERTLLQSALSLVVATFAIMLGTFPIVFYHFHQISLITFLTNVVTIPLATLTTIVSVFLIPISALSASLGSLYADAVGVMIHMMAGIASLASSIPFAVVRLPHPSSIFIVLYGLGLFYIARSAIGRIAIARTFVVVCLIVSLSSVSLGVTSKLTDANTLSVIFFDVGQGDAAMVTTPGGKSYVIDCGGISRAGHTYAERSMYPFLDAEHIPAFAGAFATHMHLDHFGGFLSLAGSRSIDTFYTCDGTSALPEARSLDSIAYANAIPVRKLEGGDVIALGDGVKAYILNPFEEARGLVSNENSLVMKVVYGNTSVLFLGDISSDVERELVARYGDFLKSDIVKAAHHGSRTSSSAELIAATRPQYAVFSSGRRNRHGHPHEEVVDGWGRTGAQLARTDHDGAVLFRSDGDTFEWASWR